MVVGAIRLRAGPEWLGAWLKLGAWPKRISQWVHEGLGAGLKREGAWPTPKAANGCGRCGVSMGGGVAKRGGVT